MKTLTALLILGGVGAVIYAVAKQGDGEGGDTFEPPGPPDLPDLPEAGFEPSPGLQPGVMPNHVDQLEGEPA